MNIGSISLQSNQPVTATDVGVAVLSKSLDTFEKAGQNMVKMMEQSVQPNLGRNIDVRV